MRVVICADAHLDSAFSVFGKILEKRKSEEMSSGLAFSKAISEAKQNDAHLLMLPGDLLDARNATRETLELFARCIRLDSEYVRSDFS